MLTSLSTRVGGVLGQWSVNNTAVLIEEFGIIFHFFSQHLYITIIYKQFYISGSVYLHFTLIMWTSPELE